MKRITQIITGACLAAALVIGLATTAQAQTPVATKVYPVAAFANTNLVTLGNYTNTAVTFPVWRGRGFTFNCSQVATNASTSNVFYTFQFATPHTNAAAGTLVTNWSTANNLTIGVPLNGTTTVFFPTNVGPLTVDNQALGRLYFISNSHLSTISVNLTNTFISAIP